MKRTLLISVAAIALAAGANVATAQKGDRAPAAPAQAVPDATNPAATGPTTANPGSRAAREHVIPEKQQTTQNPPKGTGAPQSTNAQIHRQPTPQSIGEAQHKPTNQQGANERPMESRNVSLSTEQKTTIRRKVLTASAPRVKGHVNFDIKVGVVVPRTIRVAPVPATLVEIEPAWRGYMYFVSGDEIIVVEPNSLRIVAVLDV
jgi:hypothetical protein